MPPNFFLMQSVPRARKGWETLPYLSLLLWVKTALKINCISYIWLAFSVNTKANFLTLSQSPTFPRQDDDQTWRHREHCVTQRCDVSRHLFWRFKTFTIVSLEFISRCYFFKLNSCHLSVFSTSYRILNNKDAIKESSKSSIKVNRWFDTEALPF